MTGAPVLDQTEAGFMAAVLELADVAGWLTYHVHDARRSRHGFPDLVLVGRRDQGLIFAELKNGPASKATPAQREWIDLLAANGAEAYVWRPDDWPAIETRLTTRRAA